MSGAITCTYARVAVPPLVQEPTQTKDGNPPAIPMGQRFLSLRASAPVSPASMASSEDVSPT